MSNPCKAFVREGPRKGQPCIPTTSIDSDGYCERHQRQKEYDKLIADGKRLCRMFFRGCNSQISETEKTCSNCLGKNKKQQCSHRTPEGVQCTFEIQHDKTKYCGKHHRDEYKDYEKDHTVRICNIERGCMNVCESDFLSCTSCIINNYTTNDRYYSEFIKNNNTCIFCESPYISSAINDALKQCDSCCNKFINSQKNYKVIQQRAYRNMPLKSYYNSYIKGACSRKQDISFELSFEQFTNLIRKPCFYCTISDETDFMGIDRVDNKKGYTLDNCVPCCTTCNRMKYSYSIEEFVNKCNAIYAYQLNGDSISNQLSKIFPGFNTLSTKFYGDYKHQNNKINGRNLEFTLEKEEFNSIKTKPCYLCGIENSDTHYNGIDRIDNSKGYILSNCRPCCAHCNFIKGPIPIGVLKYHIKRISENSNLQNYIHIILEEENSVEADTLSEPSEYSEQLSGRFTSKRLAELISEPIDIVMNYCKFHNRSNTFIRKVQNLYESQHEKTKEEIHISLIRFINAEVEKTHTDNRIIKKHMKTNDVLTFLEENRVDEYLDWHNETIGPETSLFRKSLEEFTKILPSLSLLEKTQQCKDILKKEQYRRHYARTSEKLKEKKESLPLYTKSTPEEEPKELPKFTKVFNAVDLPPTKPAVIEHIHDDVYIPKQWKTRDIYDFIKNDQEHHYKQYCEVSNDMSKLPTWSAMWSSFLTNVKDQPWETAEEIIRTFVEELRRVRHNTLCNSKKNVLDREDRQVWPAETVDKLFLEGRIHEYKGITEEYAGDDPTDAKWQARWNDFVRSLEAESDAKVRIERITKFMTAQRTKKYRRSKH